MTCTRGEQRLGASNVDEVHGLVAQSFALRFSSPSQSLVVAEQACTLARRLLINHVNDWDRRDAAAVASIQLANAARVAEDFSLADLAFSAAETFMRDGRPDLLAELFYNRASMLRDLGRFPEALNLLGEVAAYYRSREDNAGLARVLLSSALAEGKRGNSLGAIALAKKVLGLCNTHSQPLVFEAAVHAIVWNLLDLDLVEEAEKTWRRNRPFSRFEEPLLIAKRKWLEGRLAHASGRDADAVRLLQGALHAFEEAGQRYDIALVGIDLARAFKACGAQREAEAVSAASLPVLEGFKASPLELWACREAATTSTAASAREGGRPRAASVRRPPECPA